MGFQHQLLEDLLQRLQRRRLLLLQAVEQIDLELPDPSLSWVSTSARRLKGAEINKGSPTRPPALGSVGGRCNDHQHQGVVDELFSSEVNLRNYMEVGWRRVYCLEECCKAGCVWLRRGRLQHLLLLGGGDLQAVLRDNGSCFGLCYSMLSLYCFVLVGCFGKSNQFSKASSPWNVG